MWLLASSLVNSLFHQSMTILARAPAISSFESNGGTILLQLHLLVLLVRVHAEDGQGGDLLLLLGWSAMWRMEKGRSFIFLLSVQFSQHFGSGDAWMASTSVFPGADKVSNDEVAGLLLGEVKSKIFTCFCPVNTFNFYVNDCEHSSDNFCCW